MRDIKFRAWSHLWKEAVGVLPVLSIDFVNRTVYVLPERELEGGNQEEWLFGEIDLMQYTGLKDKNGKEIYEGDIIKWGGEELPTVIVWHERFASFGLRRNGWMHTHFFGEAVDNTDCEVIGNIYETPELINYGNNL